MSNQSTASQSAPQADGDSRPIGAGRIQDAAPIFNAEEVNTLVDYLRESERPARRQLEASLVAQTGTTIGEVLNAIQRKCLLDLMPTWTRLLRVYGQPPSGQSRTALRRDWFWGEALDAIAVALCYSEREGCAVKWIVADMVIRGEAAEAAIHAERTLCDYVNSPDGQETAEMLQRHIATYRAFAEWKS